MWKGFVLTIAMIGGAACSSDSYIANASSSTFDRLSPVGSRQVQREQQLILASHYQLYVAYVPDGLRSEDIPDLNKVAQDGLARHLKRYFSHVMVAEKPAPLHQALAEASNQSAQLLLYPRIENWPNIEPIRVRECPTEEGESVTTVGECEEKDEAQSDELVIQVGIYDVLSGRQIDAIHGRSRRGMASYLYEDSANELDELLNMMMQRLALNSGDH